MFTHGTNHSSTPPTHHHRLYHRGVPPEVLWPSHTLVPPTSPAF